MDVCEPVTDVTGKQGPRHKLSARRVGVAIRPPEALKLAEIKKLAAGRIACRRCQRQKKATRNLRSRAIGGPSRSRPGNGNAARRSTDSHASVATLARNDALGNSSKK